jgi:hypothetical protein
MGVVESYPIPPSRNGCPTTDEVRRDARRAAAELSPDVELAITTVCMRPGAPQETHLAAAARREKDLRSIFDRLSAAEALSLTQRLDRNRENDPLAVAFRRFTVDRRQRLRTYLADTRRRLAVSTVGGIQGEHVNGQGAERDG